MKNSIYLSVYIFVIFMAVKPTISEGEEENEVIEEKSKLSLTYTVNDYRTIIGWFIRKSFVIFIYRNILIKFKGYSLIF